jgi:hypothetical protein
MVAVVYGSLQSASAQDQVLQNYIPLDLDTGLRFDHPSVVVVSEHSYMYVIVQELTLNIQSD